MEKGASGRAAPGSSMPVSATPVFQALGPRELTVWENFVRVSEGRPERLIYTTSDAVEKLILQVDMLEREIVEDGLDEIVHFRKAVVELRELTGQYQTALADSGETTEIDLDVLGERWRAVERTYNEVVSHLSFQ